MQHLHMQAGVGLETAEPSQRMAAFKYVLSLFGWLAAQPDLYRARRCCRSLTCPAHLQCKLCIAATRPPRRPSKALKRTFHSLAHAGHEVMRLLKCFAGKVRA